MRSDEMDLIEYIELRLVDINGKLRGMTVPLSKPVDSLEEIKNDEHIKNGINVDGSSLPGFAIVENSDLHLEPDFSSIIELPFLERRKAAVLCFLHTRSKTGDAEDVFLGDARSLLRNTLDTQFSSNEIKIKPEPEFYLIEAMDELTPRDVGGYISISPDDESAELMIEFADNLKQMGVGVHYFHHEVGPSQQEFEISFSDVMKNVDNLVTLKPTLKAIANNYGTDVTFMPKPFEGEAGSGLHVHMQIFEGDNNLFADYDNPGKVSEYAKNFIAGIMKHAPAITGIANPSINSYKRLVPGYEAPAYITWGYSNRSVLVRVPMFKDPSKAAIEFRSPDFTTNPYLLLHVLLLAGKNGVENKLNPPEPRSDDVFELSDDQREKENIHNLPTNLGEALIALREDSFILDAMGPHLGPAWINTKGEEWRDYINHTVTDYEIDKYLNC